MNDPVHNQGRRVLVGDEVNRTSEPADVVLIGDSFTNGYCVPDDSSLAGALRRRWPRTLNLGTGGSGPLDRPL